MSGNNLFLDTNIILYLFSGDRTIANLIDEKQIYISFITELELLGYKEIQDNELGKINTFLSECKIININSTIKNNTIFIKRKYSLMLPDCIIAGTSMFLGFPLITADRDFKNINEINLILYEK
jgi:predicted nucleic acid-binding protein